MIDDNGYWRTDAIKWENMDKRLANLLLQQSEKKLQETLKTNDIATARTDKMVSIFLPLEVALFTYIFKNIGEWNSFIILTAIFCSIVILIALIFWRINYNKYPICSTGFPPDTIVTPYIIDNIENTVFRYNNLILTLCEGIQERIKENNDVNKKIVFRNEKALKILYFIILCPALGYFLHRYLL